jgi:hypothetical protein
MPRTAPALFAAAVLATVLAGAGPPAAMAGERWRRPLPGGAVAARFTFDRAAPYERGRRRGIDLAGRPGAPVLAACGGAVTYAGRVPGHGRGVTLRCGRLVATELGLGSVAVRRGARVLPGTRVGRLGAGGVLRLGARAAADRHGYRDPLALLDGAGPGGPSVAPPATARRGRRGGAPRPPRPAAAVPAAAAPVARGVPWPVVAGLALLAGGLVGGGAARARGRRRVRTGMALPQR